MAASVVTVLLWCLSSFSVGVDAEVVSVSQDVNLTLDVLKNELEVDVLLHLVTDGELQQYKAIIARNLPETSHISSVSSNHSGQVEKVNYYRWVNSYHPWVNSSLEEVEAADMDDDRAAVLQFQPAAPAGDVYVTLSYTIQGLSCITSPRPGGGQLLNMSWLEDDRIPESTLSRPRLEASSYRLIVKYDYRNGLSGPQGACFAGRCSVGNSPVECRGPCSPTSQFEVSWSDELTLNECGAVYSNVRIGFLNLFAGGQGAFKILVGFVLLLGVAVGSICILSCCCRESGGPVDVAELGVTV